MIIGILSLLLDIILNNVLKSSSLLLPLFTVLSILFIKMDDKYLVKVFILGFIYDLVFTDYYILNAFLFLMLGFLIKYLYKENKYKLLNNIILGTLILFLYQFVLFLILNIMNVNVYNIKDFLFIIKHFIINNYVYILFMSLIKFKTFHSNIVNK